MSQQYLNEQNEKRGFEEALARKEREIAAKDAEIAALKIALGRIANTRGYTEISHSELQDSYSEMRRVAKAALNARAAIEMSGGVK